MLFILQSVVKNTKRSVVATQAKLKAVKLMLAEEGAEGSGIADSVLVHIEKT